MHISQCNIPHSILLDHLHHPDYYTVSRRVHYVHNEKADLWLRVVLSSVNSIYTDFVSFFCSLLHVCNSFAFHRLCYVMNGASTNNIVRLCLHEHQMLQVQQMRMIIIGPVTFSKIVSSIKTIQNKCVSSRWADATLRKRNSISWEKTLICNIFPMCDLFSPPQSH